MSTSVAARALELLGSRSPRARALARVASLATQVEPALLRRLRLRFVPDADAGVEADLSLSGVVRFRSLDGLVFDGDVANTLRAELAQDAVRLDEAWDETGRAHRHLPLAIRLEEELAYRLLRGDDASRERIRVLLRAAVTALVAGDDGLAHWAARALPRFPASLLSTFEEARMLHAGALTRLDTPLDDAIPGETPLPSWLGWIAPPSTGRIRTHLRLSAAFPGATPGALDRRLEMGTPDAIAAGTPLDLPPTDPLVVDVMAADEGPPSAHGRSADRVVATLRFSTELQDSVSAVVPDGPLRLRTLLGEEHRLEPVEAISMRAARDIIDFSGERERHRPFFGEKLVAELTSAIDAALDKAVPDRGAWLVVTGRPGSGRSALLAATLDAFERRQTAVAQHFFRSDVPSWGNPARAALSLSAQIEARFPFAAADRSAAAVPARWLDAQLTRFAQHTSSDRLVIVLDALDEARTGRQLVTDFLPMHLPPRVIVVSSVGTGYRGTLPSGEVSTFAVDDADPAQEASIREYLAFHGIHRQEAAELCDGNWTFAAMLADLLRAFPEAPIGDIGRGNVVNLAGRLLAHLGRAPGVMAAVVAVAREPVPRDLVDRCVGTSTPDDLVLIKEEPPTGSGRRNRAWYEIPSAEPLLLTIRQPGVDHEAFTIRTQEVRDVALNSIDLLRTHRLIATSMTGSDVTPAPFVRRHLLFHAAKSADRRLVRQLTRDVSDLARRVREDGIHSLIEDLLICEREMPGVLDLTAGDVTSLEPSTDGEPGGSGRSDARGARTRGHTLRGKRSGPKRSSRKRKR